MSKTNVVEIKCDHCGNWLIYENDVPDSHLIDGGWIIDGDSHYCDKKCLKNSGKQPKH